MPAANINSTWSSGDLIFYEAGVGRSVTGDVFKIGTSVVQVGNTSQDVDFAWYASGSKSFVLDAGAGTLTMSGIDVTLTGDLTIDAGDFTLEDGDDLGFGDDQDTLMRWSVSDDSNHAFVIGLGDTSQQMHITDKAAIATDWARTAGTHPELAIHSNTTPASDYLAIGNHDGTTAHINVVGGTTLSLDIAGTGVAAVTAGLLTVTGRVVATGLPTDDDEPTIGIGNYDTALVDTSTGDSLFMQSHVSTATNKSSAGNSTCAGYFMARNTAHTTLARLQSVVGHTHANFNCNDAYGVQGHLTVDSAMQTTVSNAHVTGISGKATCDANVGQGWVTGGLFIIDGTGVVTGLHHGVAIVAELTGPATGLDALLYLYSGVAATTGISMNGTCTTGIDLAGTHTKGIDFSSGTWTQGVANFCMAYGTASAAVSVAATDTIIPIQCSLSVASDDGDTVGTSYFKVATGGALTGQLANVMVRTAVSHDLLDAYGVQSHLVFGDTATMETAANNAHLTAMSAKVTFDTSTVTKGWVNAGLFIIEGAGTCSQMCHGVSIVEEAGSTGAQSLLHLYTDVGTTPAFSFSSADGSGKTVYTHEPTTIEGSIRVLVNGNAKFIPFYTTE